MSKEPSCAKQHNPPITTETVVTGPNNTLDNVVVYISAGADDADAPAQAVTFTQKGCQYIPHVIALHTGQELQVINADQTSHNIHPLAKVNHRVEQVTAAGITCDSSQVRSAGIYFGEVQHSPLDARLVCSLENQPLLHQRRWRWVFAAKLAAGKVHRDCVA